MRIFVRRLSVICLESSCNFYLCEPQANSSIEEVDHLKAKIADYEKALEENRLKVCEECMKNIQVFSMFFSKSL